MSTIIPYDTSPNTGDKSMIGLHSALRMFSLFFLLMLFISTTQAKNSNSESNTMQQRTFSGKVTDENDIGLPGVNILEKGTSNGTVTDAEGRYTIASANTDAILIFSFVGYASEEVKAENSDALNVKLLPDLQTLGEIVVVGYGVQKRADLTGSVGSVKGKDINNLPTRSVAESLQGRVAGVEVVKDDGAPGAQSTIRIRGVSSLNNPDPIYIIDGVRSSSGASFNMQDIETIDVLKDASAASIYGASAAGGVIIITTKKGKSGALKVNFNAYTGISKPILNDLLNRDNFVIAKAATLTDVTNGAPIETLPNTDWVDELYQNGMENNYNLSISGGSEKSSFYLSAGYINEKGTFIDTDFKRYNLRLNSDHKLGKRLKIGQFLLLNKTYNNGSASEGDFPFRSIPTMAVYDPTNPIGGFGKAPVGFGGSNRVGTELVSDLKDEGFGMEGNIFGELEFIKGLKLKSTVGYNFGSYTNTQYRGAYDFGPVNNFFPSLEKSISNNEFLTANTTLSYSRLIGKHNLQVIAGYERLQAIGSDLRGFSSNLALAPTRNFFVTDVIGQRVYGGYDDNNLINSFFGRMNYDFNGKYLFTASVRRDANYLKFGPGNQAGVFPSFSVGWKLNEEGFIQNSLPMFDLIKLRASYGQLGNDQIDGYLFQPRFTTVGQNSFGGGVRSVGFGTAGLSNPAIKWESINQTNLGLDLSLLQSKLNLTFEYYIKDTDGMIYDTPLPLSAGVGETITANVGKVSNKGFEWVASYTDQVGEFSFTAAVTGALNKNKVVALDGVSNNPINDGDNDVSGGFGVMTGQNISRTIVGRSFGEFYGYIADGIFATDEEAKAYAQFDGVQSKAGDLRFRDVDSNGILDLKDQQFMGNPNPKVSYGINLRASWKGIDVSVLFNGLAGVDIFNGVAPYKSYFLGDGNTGNQIFKTSFFNGNWLTDEPAVGHFENGNFLNDPNGNYTRVSSFWVEKGDYLKLKNIQLGYSLPAKWTKTAKLTSLRFYVMANNVFALTNYKGLDPEISGNVTNRGIDAPSQYPRNRLYTLGIDINF
jgi:TonB-dependent starch-binding outer membrane protein SusC